MIGALDTIGLVSGVLGLMQFGDSLFDDDPPARGATVRVKTGRNQLDDPGMGGDVGAVYAWDSSHTYIGEADGSNIGPGDFADYVVDQYEGGVQAHYVGVHADDDAVCIAWITVSQLDQSNNGAWLGDIGKACGHNWYVQKEEAGEDKDGNAHTPYCTWLDGDHNGGKGTPDASMKFKVHAYGKQVNDTIDNDFGCEATVWGEDKGPVFDKPSNGKNKRSFRPKASWMENVLIMSNITSHSAQDLCNSETSWGPDFIDGEGMYCDMSEHTLRPLCETQQVEGCIRIDDDGKVLSKRTMGLKRTIDEAYKSYNRVSHWGR